MREGGDHGRKGGLRIYLSGRGATTVGREVSGSICQGGGRPR